MPLRPTTFFYLGVFPLLMLVWAWVDSVKAHSDWAIRRKPHQTLVLELSESRVGWRSITRTPDNTERLPALTPWYGKVNRFGSMQTRKDGTPVPVFPMPMHDELQPWYPPGYHYRVVTIPLWLIVCGYLALWLPISWRCARRAQKLRAGYFAATGAPALEQDKRSL